MNKREVTIQKVSPLPMQVGGSIPVRVAYGSRVRGVCLHDGVVGVVIESPLGCGDTPQATVVDIMVVPTNQWFYLPANHAFLGTVDHPKHGLLCVYDVTH